AQCPTRSGPGGRVSADRRSRNSGRPTGVRRERCRRFRGTDRAARARRSCPDGTQAADDRAAIDQPAEPASRSERRGCAARGEARGPLRFWDSSAIVPLTVAEARTEALLETAAGDPVMCVWWATEIECVSAL